MITSQKFKITGLTPLIMHCGQTADPLNQFSRAMKKASGKRNKTDEDLAVLASIEWWAGLYMSPAAEIDGETVSAPAGAKLTLPSHIIDSVIREGARKQKLGKQASAGAIVEGDAAFEHDGPRDINKLALDSRFLLRCAVKVSTSKVIRTRPIFPAWSAVFAVQVDESVIEVDQVKQSLDAAGKLVGIGDWRPGAPRGGNYGRFTVEVVA